MPSQSVTLLNREPIEASSYGKGVDLGAYSSLETQVIVHSVGGATAGTLILQHSAVDEHQTYLSLTTGVGLDGTGNTYESESGFLRYVRWYADGNLNGAPVVSIHVVAKEK